MPQESDNELAKSFIASYASEVNYFEQQKKKKKSR